MKTILLSINLFIVFVANANNIALSNLTLTNQNTSAGINNPANYTMVQFDLSWENSWRVNTGPSNWDAAWVFVKFRVGGSDPNFTDVSSSGTTVNVNSTANLRVGMPVRVTGGTGIWTGAFAANSFISNILNDTQFTVNQTPTTVLFSADIECIRIWEHASLNIGGHVAATGSIIEPGLRNPSNAFNPTTNPALGVFIYRDAIGLGNNNFNQLKLRWDYAANGINDNMPVSVQAFAIEMVYVPGGVEFNVGGGGGTSAFTSTTIDTGDPTVVPSGISNLGGAAGGFPSGQVAPNIDWPNGYNPFYCMKYEISQGQYRDFLNLLTRQQQDTRTTTALLATTTSVSARFVVAGATTALNRNGIRCDASIQAHYPITFYCDLNANGIPNEANDGEWIACNFLSWMDGCAYLDWAGLRPMTEMEYEKACRGGNQVPVIAEFAWGTNTITAAASTGITNGGRANELVSTLNANCAYNSGTTSPLRVGIFAQSNTTRIQSGATYYGIMEMTGNLWEPTVFISNINGRSYRGVHGDGNLFFDGSANVDFWPGINGITGASVPNTVFHGTTGITAQPTSALFRGGGYMSSVHYTYVSMRSNTNASSSTVNPNLVPATMGFRGVRSQ